MQTARACVRHNPRPPPPNERRVCAALHVLDVGRLLCLLQQLPRVELGELHHLFLGQEHAQVVHCTQAQHERPRGQPDVSGADEESERSSARRTVNVEVVDEFLDDADLGDLACVPLSERPSMGALPQPPPSPITHRRS
jgi:hypothetical protein